MTATVSVEVTRRDDVLRVPSAALRFKPTSRVLTALGEPPADSGRESERWQAGGNAGSIATPAAQETVWIYEGGHLRPARVTVGATDGSFTEIVDGDVQEGTTLAMRVTLPGAQTASRNALVIV